MRDLLSLIKNTRVLFLFAIFSTFLFSCSLFEDPRPECEINNTGNVILKNHTGTILYTFTEFKDGRVYTETLAPWGTANYSNVPAGQVIFEASFDEYTWYDEYEFLEECNDLEFTWGAGSKKFSGELIGFAEFSFSKINF